MDREMLQRHLKQTEDHIALSDKHIAEQRALIARLEHGGLRDDATAAKELLFQLQDTRRLHFADRERLQRALSELGS
jgi:hypothetical protein